MAWTREHLTYCIIATNGFQGYRHLRGSASGMPVLPEHALGWFQLVREDKLSELLCSKFCYATIGVCNTHDKHNRPLQLIYTTKISESC